MVTIVFGAKTRYQSVSAVASETDETRYGVLHFGQLAVIAAIDADSMG